MSNRAPVKGSVDILGERCEVTAYPDGKTKWVATGKFRGTEYQGSGGSAKTAFENWKFHVNTDDTPAPT